MTSKRRHPLKWRRPNKKWRQAKKWRRPRKWRRPIKGRPPKKWRGPAKWRHVILKGVLYITWTAGWVEAGVKWWWWPSLGGSSDTSPAKESRYLHYIIFAHFWLGRGLGGRGRGGELSLNRKELGWGIQSHFRLKPNASCTMHHASCKRIKYIKITCPCRSYPAEAYSCMLPSPLCGIFLLQGKTKSTDSLVGTK